MNTNRNKNKTTFTVGSSVLALELQTVAADMQQDQRFTLMRNVLNNNTYQDNSNKP